MKKITYLVLSAHFLAFLFFTLTTPEKKKETKPLKVHTVVKAPAPLKQEEVVVVKNTPPPPKKPPVKTPPLTQTKKPIAKNPVAKKPQPPPIKKSPQISDALRRQLQESIAKIDETSHKESPKSALKAPNEIVKLDMGLAIKGEEKRFAAILVECLQTALDLPEKGAVKVELTLKNDGSFVKMEILQSKSERNRVFLEQELQMVKYPSFSGSLKNEKEHAFVITFCNS